MLPLVQEWILTALIALPLLGAAALMLLPGGDSRDRAADGLHAGRSARGAGLARTALTFSLATGALAVLAVALFFEATGQDGERIAGAGEYALVQNLTWVTDAPTAGRQVDFRYHVGVDGLSIWLLALTAFITPLAVWASFSGIRHREREYYVLMLLLEAGMIGVFCARDLLVFYIFFEFTLVPLFFIIGIWGGPRKWAAAGKFFLYTFTGSMLTFAGVLYLAYQASLTGNRVFTFDLDTLYQLHLSERQQFWLFLAFAAGFAIKVPLFPFHTWLPLAHTEAPTAGSVLLAGVLLKLGTYGFLRFNLPMLPDATQALAPFMAVLAVVGIIYGALVAWVQDDFKRLVAYSSVSHLGFCMLGMFALNQPGLTGSLLYMVNHGLSTGALFLVVGMIYERYHTREFGHIGGLARRMPWMAFFLVFFVLSSIALPGLNGFVSEFLVLLGAFTSGQPSGGWPPGPLGVSYAVVAAVGIILGAVYMLAMVQRVLFGPLKEPPHTPETTHGLSVDLTPREIGVLTPIAIACLVLGLWPQPVIDTIQPAAQRHVLSWVYAGGDEAFVQAHPMPPFGTANKAVAHTSGTMRGAMPTRLYSGGRACKTGWPNSSELADAKMHVERLQNLFTALDGKTAASLTVSSRSPSPERVEHPFAPEVTHP